MVCYFCLCNHCVNPRRIRAVVDRQISYQEEEEFLELPKTIRRWGIAGVSFRRSASYRSDLESCYGYQVLNNSRGSFSGSFRRGSSFPFPFAFCSCDFPVAEEYAPPEPLLNSGDACVAVTEVERGTNR